MQVKNARNKLFTAYKEQINCTQIRSYKIEFEGIKADMINEVKHEDYLEMNKMKKKK